MEEELVSVAGLHALTYCERLFYLEEVERIRVADERVFAGRRLHVEDVEPDEEVERRRLEFESHTLGIRGAVDVLRRRDGSLVPWEHKRGKSAPSRLADDPGARAPQTRAAWETDRIQVGAYALLVEEAYGQTVFEARIRYHADNVSVAIRIDDELRGAVGDAIRRARQLRASVERPPVTLEQRKCEHCSLAPVCLPEESRLAADPAFRPIRLLPQHPAGQTLHVLEHGAAVGREGERLVVRVRDAEPTRVPVATLGQVVLHGMTQISTQAIRLCVDNEIGVQWVSFAGALIGSLAPTAQSAQRHLRQFRALSDDSLALALARRVVYAKLSAQLRYVLRATRGGERVDAVSAKLQLIRAALRKSQKAASVDELMGLEGAGAAAYFSVWNELLTQGATEPRLRYVGRNRQPPTDRVSAILGYAYGMLYREALQAIVAVGLHPGVGFYHRPRSSSHPLALDVMEIFRVPMVDMAVIGALNRRTFDADRDFVESPGRVLLSDTGRKKVVDVIERRRSDVWRHDVVDYSLSYGRMVELEVRLLEKEWMGEGGLFAKMRIR